MKLEPHRVGGERSARQARPLDRAFALFDPLLARPALVVEGNDALGRAAHVLPGQGENLRLGLYVELPAGCANVTEPRGSMVNNGYSERWTAICAGGLTGGTVHIVGLSATMTDVL